jgi:hypothetical protein
LNLHGIVAGQIAGVNPFVSAIVQRSAGYTTATDGSRSPTFSSFSISAQIQALTYSDLTHLDGLNIAGVRRAMYLTGEVEGLVRVAQKGGDLIVFPVGTLPEGTTWLAAYVLEAWPDWRKIALTLQNQ